MCPARRDGIGDPASPLREASPAGVWIDRLFALCVSLGFVAYFGLCCLKHEWSGDIFLYVAAVHSLYSDFFNPLHETLAIPGTYSNFYSPYIVAVAAGGAIFGVTGYRVLQYAGIANLILYLAAVRWFFRAHSVFPGRSLPPALFVLISLLLQNEAYHWSSETSLRSMVSIQAYPSMVGWTIALTLWAASARFIERGGMRFALTVAVAAWLITLVHPLTATWALGVTLLRGLISLAGGLSRLRLRRAAMLMGFTAAGVVLTPLWPYIDIFDVATSVQVEHSPPFAGRPFAGMATLYVLAIPCLVIALRARRHGFLVVAFLATFLAYLVSQWLGIGYGNRYIIFMAFFAQVLLAEAASIGPLALLGSHHAQSCLARWRTPAASLLASACTLLVVAAAIGSPAVRTAVAKRRVLSPAELVRAGSPHDAFYSRFSEVDSLLGAGDVVLAPNRPLNIQLAPVTGARPVVAPFAFRAPDLAERMADTDLFFSPQALKTDRKRIIRKYRANRILLGPTDLSMKERIAQDMGPPDILTDRFALFVVE